MSRSAMRVGVLGAGTVGSQVVSRLLACPELLQRAGGPRVEIVGVAVRDVARAVRAGIPARLATDAAGKLVAGTRTDVIVELMGGDEPARTLIAAALSAGKPVVTANKHVIARHGPDLEAIARRTGAALRFEASVGGGIPLLTPLASDLAVIEITRVRGVVNGTTNMILSGMANDGLSYRQALAAAQAAGYAEAEPSGDVEGADAVNKLVILARLAFGHWADPQDVERRPPTLDGSMGKPGISGVEEADVRAAAAFGLRLKLLADARRTREEDEVIEASVIPTAIVVDDPMARLSGVTNRIEVRADPIPGVAFSGPGAGGATTSNAVFADLLAIARGGGSTWAGLPSAGVAPRSWLAGPPEAAVDRGWLAVMPAAAVEAGGRPGAAAGAADLGTADAADTAIEVVGDAVAVYRPGGTLPDFRSILATLLNRTAKVNPTIYPVDLRGRPTMNDGLTMHPGRR